MISSPDHRPFDDAHGVQPDFVVEHREGEDPTFEKGIEVLEAMVAARTSATPPQAQHH